jgi:hypothetical protein
MMTTSSGVLGYVRTESIFGALLPRVKVVRLSESTPIGTTSLRAASTEAMMVAVGSARNHGGNFQP